MNQKQAERIYSNSIRPRIKIFRTSAEAHDLIEAIGVMIKGQAEGGSSYLNIEGKEISEAVDSALDNVSVNDIAKRKNRAIRAREILQVCIEETVQEFISRKLIGDNSCEVEGFVDCLYGIDSEFHGY